MSRSHMDDIRTLCEVITASSGRPRYSLALASAVVAAARFPSIGIRLLPARPQPMLPKSELFPGLPVSAGQA